MSVQRVAFVVFHACPLAAPGQGKSGGMNVYVRELAQALGEKGVQVDLFTRVHAQTKSVTEQISPMVRVVHLPGGGPDASMDSMYQHLPQFLNAVRDFQQQNGLEYDLVHSHYWLSGWVGQRIAKEWRIPHVVTFHTLGLIKMQSRAGEVELEERQVVEAELMASAQRIVAFSPHERDSMVKLYHADAGKVTLAPCGVDLSLFRPLDQRQARDRLGLNGEKVFLYVGRLEPLKGIELLLHTTAHLETSEPVRVLVVGGSSDGDKEMDRLKEVAKSLKVDDVIDFVGRVDQEELPYYYNAADVCVVPSYYESFGLAALEAMACGTPVVAARVGGIPTIVQHGHTGYLMSWRCPEGFANSLEMIISSSTLQHSMGVAARRRAEGMGWTQVAGSMARLYETLTEDQFQDDNS